MTLSALHASVPAAKRAAVARAIAVAFPDREVERLERMTEGLSGAGVFRLSVAGETYVLRLETEPDGFRDPVRHYACLRIAADAGVAPQPLYLDAVDGVAVTTFVAAEPFLSLTREERIMACARTVRTLHAAALFPPLVDFFDGMNALWGQLEASGIVPTEILTRYLARYRALAGAYPRNTEPPVASHNDLNPTNVLFAEGRAWFVDWESAFAADRYVDLATLANYYCADDADEALLLETYFGAKPDDAARARLYLMLQVVRAYYGILLLITSSRERPGLKLASSDLDTPPLAEIRSQMGRMATLEGRVTYACAFLTEAFRASEGAQYEAATASLCVSS